MNQGLREAVLRLQRRSEEHDKIEQELRARETYLKRRCEDLQHRLDEKTRQLEAEIQKRKAAEEMLLSAKKDAEKRTQGSTNFSTWRTTTAFFAHEVANSLNGIFACLQLLDMKAQDQGRGDPELKSLVESATDEIKRLGGLLKDFRSFAQPQSLDFEPTDLHKLINEVIAADKPVRVTQLELDLLHYFSRNPRRVLTREELLERVWHLHNSPNTRSVAPMGTAS